MSGAEGSRPSLMRRGWPVLAAFSSFGAEFLLGVEGFAASQEDLHLFIDRGKGHRIILRW